jgi:hypothetical protein
LPFSFPRKLRLAATLLLVFAGALAPRVGARLAAAQEILTSGHVRVVYPAGQRARAEEVAALANRPMRLPGLGDAVVPESTTIYVAATRAAFDSLAGGDAPEWAGGVAIPETRTIIIPAFAVGDAPYEPVVTLRHELAHVILNARLPHPIPRWFDEGYAEIASGGWDGESAWQLRVAFVTGRAPPLDSLALGWPAGADRARLAYLLSATAVLHLERRDGEAGFRLLLDNWRRDGSLDAAVRTTYGLTMGQLEDEWRASVKRDYGWLQALSSTSAVWMLTLAVLFIAWLPRRKRNRAKLAEMRAEERMLPPPREDGVDVEYPIG